MENGEWRMENGTWPVNPGINRIPKHVPSTHIVNVADLVVPT